MGSTGKYTFVDLSVPQGKVSRSSCDAPTSMATDPDRMAELAVAALIDEARLTPKPGLVDDRNCGAHDDMDLPLLLRSAHSLRPSFRAAALCSQQLPFGPVLRAELGRIGRQAERDMAAATDGVNTHRGAVFALGLLVSAAAAGRAGDAGQLARAAGELARMDDVSVDDPVAGPRSHGAVVRDRYGAGGALAQARAGFPHVIHLGLPMLRVVHRFRAPRFAELDTLLALMASLDDSCVLYRGGPSALRLVQRGARTALISGGSGTARGMDEILRLDDQMCARGVSPGGCADLLAATLFVDRVTALPAIQNAPRVDECRR